MKPWYRQAETVYCLTDVGAGALGVYVATTTGGFGGIAFGLFVVVLVVYMAHAMLSDVVD